jgi:hypothetical protein
MFGFGKQNRTPPQSRRPNPIDEFLDGGDPRSADPFDLMVQARVWSERLGSRGLSRDQEGVDTTALQLPAFTLLRDGDLFERSASAKPPRTELGLLSHFASEKVRIEANGLGTALQDAVLQGVLRVLSGTPALCRRMLLSKPLTLTIVPNNRSFSAHGFPNHTNPNAVGLFWNRPELERARLGFREACIPEKPWLMVHEMTHAVHLLALTVREREDIDRFLLPVYGSRRWVEEALAIYAERAFGADYGENEYDAPGIYARVRRHWNDRHVFSRFVDELFHPDPPKKRAVAPRGIY